MEEKLEALYQECRKELESIGILLKDKQIVIQIAKRNNKRYGCCRPEQPDERYKTVTRKGYRYIIKYENYQKYTIEISKWVMELEESVIKNTIIHELIHCLPYCNNHGAKFKEYAAIINERLGYNITRVGNKKEDFTKSHLEYHENIQYHYKIQCEKCGQTFYRQRMQRNFLRKYRCGKCRGKLKVENIAN